MMQRLTWHSTSIIAVLLTLGLTACSQSPAPNCGALSVVKPWVRSAPEGMDVMAAYFTLANNGNNKVIVNGVTSSQFDRAEMHETVVNDDGQASMHPVETVAIDAGERLGFEPGGRHVMLFKPSQHYAAGDQVELILSCGTQQAELPVAAVVRAAQPEGASGGAMHKDHGPESGGAPASDTPGDNAGTGDDSATAQ